MSSRKEAREATDDSRTAKMLRRARLLRCPLCPPHKYENRTWHGARGPKKPRKRWKRTA